jgi:hypothetical protein
MVCTRDSIILKNVKKKQLREILLRRIKRNANSVGLINWLRQPGQIRNRLQKSMRVKSFQFIKSCGTLTDPSAETKSIGLPADALVPCFLLAT